MIRASIIALQLFIPSTWYAVPASGTDAASLTVRLDCLTTARGVVRIALFDSADDHLRTAMRSGIVHADIARLDWRAADLPEGDYSLAIYHDVNDNGKLDRNFVGWPKEPYGFSNNVRIRLGPPRWHTAKMAVAGATETTICVQ